MRKRHCRKQEVVCWTREMKKSGDFTSRIFCKCKCHCWVWRMIDSLYYSSRKIRERYENSFVNCRINYQKFCYSLQRIWTQPLYSFPEMNFLYIQLLVSYWILLHNWKQRILQILGCFRNCDTKAIFRDNNIALVL